MQTPFPDLPLAERISAIYALALRIDDRLRHLEQQWELPGVYNKNDIKDLARLAGVQVL